jgi:peroxisomal 2,4-dienoyl-CoA reductase
MTEAFLHHGAAGACIVSRTQERLDAAKKELEGKIPGAKVLAVAADVRKPEEMLEAARKCVEKFGRIDVRLRGRRSR